jgi:hypothetical protein
MSKGARMFVVMMRAEASFYKCGLANTWYVTRSAAEAEALRLKQLRPFEEYYVFEAIGHAVPTVGFEIKALDKT